MSDSIGGKEYTDKGEQLRKVFPDNVKRHLMYEGELTIEQRESEQPIGIKNGKPTFRMYRCICAVCNQQSRKLPYSKSLEWTLEHNKITGHFPIKQEGGVFFKEDLYK